MKKKVYSRGVLERVGRVTVNTTFFALSNVYALWLDLVPFDIKYPFSSVQIS